MSIIQSHKAFWGPIAELIERARLVSKGMGLSSEKMTDRLIRYYAAQGVLDKPDRLGRDAAYNYRHLLQLLTARRLSEKGVSLEIIGRHNLSTTTELLETGLIKPVQMDAFITPPRSEAGVTVPKTFPASSVAIVDVLSEVRAIRDQFNKDHEALRKVREVVDEFASQLKEFHVGLEGIKVELEAVVRLVKTGMEKMYQSEDKFEYMLEKNLSAHNEKFNYLVEGIERVERTLFKIEISSGQAK
jgi:DNA-binding transcriptional MerR regulator